ncbi:MAG: inositol monophosphatase [Chitinispirillales bacterium]|jgi:histidinol phosphatase-like enzyme (inositol monophosphatase family)|nr:inositol monophosphatase [Chitinispirillales bacterium]
MLYEKEIEPLKEIVQIVGKYQLEMQKKLKNVNIKQDKSLVTEVDVNSEKTIREYISTKFPNDGFLGEEYGETIGESDRRWIIDPLDGTFPYVHGIPTYSVLIALEVNGILSAGITHFPALNETYWATLGGGAFCNGEKLTVSQTAKIPDSTASALGIVEAAKKENGKKLFKILQKCGYFYGFMDAYSYVGVAAGKLDFCVSLIDKPWDKASSALIVKEAGGIFSDLSGKETIYGDDFIVSNKNIHKAVLKNFT